MHSHRPGPDWLLDFDAAVSCHPRAFTEPRTTVHILRTLAAFPAATSGPSGGPPALALCFPRFVATRLEPPGQLTHTGGQHVPAAGAAAPGPGAGQVRLEAGADAHITKLCSAGSLPQGPPSSAPAPVSSSGESSPLERWSYLELCTALQCLRHFGAPLSSSALEAVGARMGALMLRMSPHDLHLLRTGQAEVEEPEALLPQP